MNNAFLFFPVIALAVSVLVSVRAVKKGKSAKKAFATQLLTFLAICAVSFAAPVAVHAATSGTAAASDGGLGMGLLAAALSTGLGGIGGGIAVAAASPAAIGATSEDPKAFGKALIFVALGEGIALYGLLMSILILNKI